ncbi:hypothetical protein MJD09_11705 [bacterium]|nr:hypothetical protein [bacterium]
MSSLYSVSWLFTLFFVLCLACFNPFAPELDRALDLTNVITEQQTPEEVLQNFRYAYTFKDSLLYSDVIDESFIFEFFDPNAGPSGSFQTWGRDIDLRTTGRLFRGADVIDLVWLNTLFTDREDDLEKRFVRFNLTLSGSDFSFFIGGTAIFTFQQSEADGKWRIVRWKDESDL